MRSAESALQSQGRSSTRARLLSWQFPPPWDRRAKSNSCSSAEIAFRELRKYRRFPLPPPSLFLPRFTRPNATKNTHPPPPPPPLPLASAPHISRNPPP